MSLAEQVRLEKDNIFTIEDNGQILGILSAGHTLLHCIPNISSAMLSPIAQFLKKHALEGSLVQCINGEARASAFLSDALLSLGQKAQEVNRYILLSISPMSGGMDVCPPPPAGLAIVCCENTAKTADALMPLQIAYIKEEVIPSCRPLSAAAARLVLEEALRQQRVFAMLDAEGNPVAKVSLNNAGFHCVQLGGVYTLPKWRKQGCAASLAGSVSRAMLQSGRQVVLYVKESNAAAQRLYRRLGYTPFGRLSIIYY